MKPDNFHQRYVQQAGWTRGVRDYLLPRVRIAEAKRILDLGCGTGALLGEFQRRSRGHVFGVDIDMKALEFANRPQGKTSLIGGDGYRLPFATGSLDLVVCHFFLLWVEEPVMVLKEAVRVLKSGGFLTALAEPDYGGRVDYPDEFKKTGKLQTQSLQQKGARIEAGRELGSNFYRAGLMDVVIGVMGGEWHTTEFDELEIKVMRTDLAGKVDEPELKQMEKLEREARQIGERVLFVPTFWAMGVKQ